MAGVRYLGGAAAAAIDSIGRRLDLDFCGVDFGIGAGGELVVFEANATMLIHPEPSAGPLSFKNAGVLRIVTAMQELLLRAKGGVRKQGSVFFFEKKEPKNFYSFGLGFSGGSGRVTLPG